VEIRQYDGVHFLDALPEEAMAMSGNGIAIGFDLLRWGERWHKEGRDTCPPVVRIDEQGVQFLVMTNTQKAWVDDPNISEDRRKIRRKALLKHNWRSWLTLGEDDRNYLLSLLWVPEEPLTPLEILAKMAE